MARSRRTIHMPATVVTALKAHRTEQRKIMSQRSGSELA
jgi:hypothetical protein